MRHSMRFVVLLLVSALVLALVGGVVAQDAPKVLITGRQMGASDIPTIDPALAEDVPSVQVAWQFFVELQRFNEETSELQDGMASYTTNDDASVFTFSILPEVSWVRYNAQSGQVEQVLDENGSPRFVTAADFAYGIARTLDPASTSYVQTVLSKWIAGMDAYDGSNPEVLGLNVIDTYTLEVTVSQPSSVAPQIFGMWMTSAQPQWAIEAHGDFWTDPANINTYGPFTLKEWVRGDGGSLTMVKNPFWVGTDAVPSPMLDEVVFRFLDAEQQLAEFEAGGLDVAEAPGSAVPRITSDPTLSNQYNVALGSCTYYYGFNVERTPFDDARARRAFSMAIDRAALTENVLGAGEIPASFFSFPALVAAPTSDDFPEGGIFTDISMAQDLWNDYLTETGQNAADFNITLFHNNSNLHATIAQAVQQMWADALGVTVQIATSDFATYLETRGDYDVFRAGWCYDYPDTHNFLYDAGWHSDLLANNDTHWSNPAYDALVDAGFVAETVAERQALYAQAEEILVNEDAAIAPMYYYVTKDLTQPYVSRTYSVITREAYERWDLNR